MRAHLTLLLAALAFTAAVPTAHAASTQNYTDGLASTPYATASCQLGSTIGCDIGIVCGENPAHGFLPVSTGDAQKGMIGVGTGPDDGHGKYGPYSGVFVNLGAYGCT